MADPNCVVFSRGKADWNHTSRWFKEYSFNHKSLYYVISDDDDYKGYRKSTGCRVVRAKGSYNLASKRQWALENLTSRRQPWQLFFEDNIIKVTSVGPERYDLPRLLGKTRRATTDALTLTPFDVVGRMLEDIKLAESVGAYYGGFASNDNHYFRKKKYRTVAFVWSKMGYVRRGGASWPCYLNDMDDYGFTAECLADTGRVLVNNYLHAYAKRFEGRGGSGTLADRVCSKREAVLKMHDKFPGLFRDRSKVDSPDGTEIQLRFSSESQVDKWRASL